MRSPLNCSLKLAVATLLTLSHNAYAAPVYRETFQFCPRVQNDQLHSDQLVGWKALRKNKQFGDGGFLKSSEPGSPNVLKAFRSFPAGLTSGNVLWTKDTTGLTILTDEFSFDIGSITSVSYDQRFDGLNTNNNQRDGSKIALLINNTWYISDQQFNVAKRSVWETVSANLASLTFGTVVVAAGVGPSSPANSGITLPNTGTVTSFGVYVPRVNDRVRIDNYTLSDTQPDGFYGAGEDGDTSVCPNLNAQGTPIATPTPKVNSNTFCSEAQLTSLGSLNTTKSRLKKSVVLGLPGRTLKGLRDRALLSLMLTANPRVDLLTNIIVADYDRVNGVLRLPSTVRPDGFIGTVSSTIDIPLNKFAKKHMEAYLKRYLKDKDTTKYLFPRVNRGTEKLITTSLCSKQFKRLLRLRAERENIRIKFN